LFLGKNTKTFSFFPTSHRPTSFPLSSASFILNHIRLISPRLAPIRASLQYKNIMAMPVHKDALHDALTREHERQRMEEKMTDRDSKEILLDEEGVALKDLSHQRSQGNETRPAFHSTVPSSTNVVQKGWRRSTREETMRDHNPTDTLALGRLYERMGKLSIIPRYMVYIVPLGVLIAIPIIAGAFLPQLELGVCFPLWESGIVNGRE
jgi:hypothetical protein